MLHRMGEREGPKRHKVWEHKGKAPQENIALRVNRCRHTSKHTLLWCEYRTCSFLGEAFSGVKEANLCVEGTLVPLPEVVVRK